MSKSTQQSGAYKRAICEDCGDTFTYRIIRKYCLCPKCRKRAYHRECDSKRSLRAGIRAAALERANRLAAYDAAAPEIKTVRSTVRGRVIEKRGNVPISSTATCRGRY